MKINKEGYFESEYYYKSRKILIKSKKNRGMKAHVFYPLSQDKVEFTMRLRGATPKQFLDKCVRKIDKNEVQVHS